MKTCILISVLFTSLTISAQDLDRQTVLYLSSGVSHLRIHNTHSAAIFTGSELEYKLSDMIKAGAAVFFGGSNSFYFGKFSYIESGFTLSLTPFRHSGRYRFQLGSEIFVLHTAEMHQKTPWCLVGWNPENDIHLKKSNSIGIGFSADNIWYFGKHFQAGFTLFVRSYPRRENADRRDLHAGGMLKVGYTLK